MVSIITPESQIAMSVDSVHKSVLLQESIASLQLEAGSVVMDGTFGAGGHSTAIARIIGKSGKLVSFDADKSVFSKEKVQELERLTTFISVVDNFRNGDEALKHLEIDAALFDLGLSSTQLEVSGRGFSFQRDEKLQMTFKSDPDESEGDVTASVILNDWSEDSIATILKGFGEERFARSIARGIVLRREEAPIERTQELVEIIEASTPKWYQRGRTHHATRTFQALRIATNDELGAVAQGLTVAFAHLGRGGRLSVISFHSLEDRVVKHLFRDLVEQGVATRITKKPIIPQEEELRENPRARSAKLRVIEKV